jgi:hypothetical protein
VTNPFYSSEQTELSRSVLDEVLAAVPEAVLIGGWGSWVRTGGPMSHDIDLIVSHQDLALLGTKAADISASHHLAGTKWRGTWRSIHLDLYVPYQSRLGANLQLRVEQLQAQAEMLKGYRVLSAPAHAATKIAALLDRPDSLPGRKDRHEILQLLEDPTTASAPTVIALASARSPSQIGTLLKRAFEFLAGEPGIGPRDRSRLRQIETEWQRTLAAAVERGLIREQAPSPERGFGLGI